MKAIIKNFEYRGRRFVIVEHMNHYCAIEDKYINPDGKLNTGLNGLQMYASRELKDCIESVQQGLDIEHWREVGYTKAQAIAKVFGLTEDMVKKLEQII